MDADALRQLLQAGRAEHEALLAARQQTLAELEELRAERQEREQAIGKANEILVRHDQMVAAHQDAIRYKDAKIAQLTHEIAALRRY